MQDNTSDNRRRWVRQKVTVPISLLLEAAPSHADDSAFTVDVCPRGVGVRTKLVPVRGEWVKVVAKGKSPRSIPALVIWVQKDESSHSTLAGLELY